MELDQLVPMPNAGGWVASVHHACCFLLEHSFFFFLKKPTLRRENLIFDITQNVAFYRILLLHWKETLKHLPHQAVEFPHTATPPTPPHPNPKHSFPCSAHTRLTFCPRPACRASPARPVRCDSGAAPAGIKAAPASHGRQRANETTTWCCRPPNRYKSRLINDQVPRDRTCAAASIRGLLTDDVYLTNRTAAKLPGWCGGARNQIVSLRRTHGPTSYVLGLATDRHESVPVRGTRLPYPVVLERRQQQTPSAQTGRTKSQIL